MYREKNLVGSNSKLTWSSMCDKDVIQLQRLSKVNNFKNFHN
jgi:hypothetical protein